MKPTAAAVVRPGSPPPSAGRRETLGALGRRFREPGARVIPVVGPRGVGKSPLLRAFLPSLGRPVIHLHAAPEVEPRLREALRREAEAVLHRLPEVARPGLLPTRDPGTAWIRLLDSILEGLRLAGGGTLVLDPADALRGARRRLPEEVAEAWRRVEDSPTPLKLVLVARTADELLEWSGVVGDREPVRVGALPYRVAGWLHGPVSPFEAFRFWAFFGDDPSRLHGARSGEPLEEAFRRRVLEVSGDLYDHPLRYLETLFQSPQRYLGILRALAGGEMTWGGLAQALGEGAGNRLAPYLQRLEAEGLVEVRRPLGSAPGSRDRRYAPADPFLAFWCGVVLPGRSGLLRMGPHAFWEEFCLPALQNHLDRWLPEAARRWLGSHAEELLGAPAREAGALWGREGPELEVAGRLANGVVAYGAAQRGAGPAGRDWLQTLEERMAETRYGIGREARAALLFLQGEPTPELRRGVARRDLAWILSARELMGAGPPPPPERGEPTSLDGG